MAYRTALALLATLLATSVDAQQWIAPRLPEQARGRQVDPSVQPTAGW